MRVDDADRFALGLDRLAQAAADAGDDDLFDLAVGSCGCCAAGAACSDNASATAPPIKVDLCVLISPLPLVLCDQTNMGPI